jgi:hypothetical protein
MNPTPIDDIETIKGTTDLAKLTTAFYVELLTSGKFLPAEALRLTEIWLANLLKGAAQRNSE